MNASYVNANHAFSACQSYITIHSDNHEKDVRGVRCFEDAGGQILHHPDEPAVIEYSILTGKIVTQIWYLKGQKHRDNGPAELTYSQNGILESERWLRFDQEHRVGGPACRYYRNGVLDREGWSLNGKFHRDDGPAITMYFDGQIEYELFKLDGLDVDPFMHVPIAINKEQCLVDYIQGHKNPHKIARAAVEYLGQDTNVGDILKFLKGMLS